MAQAPAKDADAFFRYAHRRTLVMMSTGAATTVVGLVAATIAVGRAAVWGAVVVVVGLVMVVGSLAGARLLREARRVLITLDLPGSTNRTPLAEFTSFWFTPGAAEGPERVAQVFGSLSKGRAVLAVADDGSCFIGRVVRIRA